MLTFHPAANWCFYIIHPLFTANFVVSPRSATICAQDFYLLRRVIERIGNRFGGRSWVLIPADVMQRNTADIWWGYCKLKNRDRQNSKDMIFIDGQLNLKNSRPKTIVPPKATQSNQTSKSKFEFHIDKLKISIREER
ncbi:hypothetical protein ACB098_01G147200 [Castanea mollissima]